jgi:hypothetical protein
LLGLLLLLLLISLLFFVKPFNNTLFATFGVLLFIVFTLPLYTFHSYTFVWSVNILVNILIVLFLAFDSCRLHRILLEIFQKLTFLWHLSISGCCYLLFILFHLILFHSYTFVWPVNILF